MGFFDDVSDFFKEKKMDSKFKDAGAGRSVAGTTPRDEEIAREKQRAIEEHLAQEQRRQQRQPPQETSKAAQAALERLEAKNKPAGQKTLRSNSNPGSQPGATVDARGKSPDVKPSVAATGTAASAQRDVPVARTEARSGSPANDENPLVVDYGVASVLSPRDSLHLCFASIRNGSNAATARLCEDTIALYLTNVVAHPGELKYRRIRMGNRQFGERVASVPGGIDFLVASGFSIRIDKATDGSDDKFLVLPESDSTPSSQDVGGSSDAHSDIITNSKNNTNTTAEEGSFGVSEADVLVGLALQLLQTAHPTPFVPERRARVLTVPANASVAIVRTFAVPSSFYDLTVDDARRELRKRKETAEKELTLRTASMRENDAAPRNPRNYRFALVRVRFPDGLVLEGAFHADERFSAVRLFVSSCLSESHKSRAFALSLPGCTKPHDDDGVSLRKLGVVPAALVNLFWRDCDAASPSSEPALVSALLEGARSIAE
eukprot:Opistho-2@73533